MVGRPVTRTGDVALIVALIGIVLVGCSSPVVPTASTPTSQVPTVPPSIQPTAAPTTATTTAPTFPRTGWLREPRKDHSATLLVDGRVLVAGGAGADHMAMTSVEMFDPSTRTWLPAAPLHAPRHSHFAIRLLDGRVLVVGGWSSTTGRYAPIESAEVLDPITGVWTEIAGVPGYVLGNGSGILLADGRVVVHGVQYRENGPVGLLYSFDPETERWSRLARVPEARAGPTVSQLQDGRLLVAGGSWPTSELPSPTPDAWAYDVAANTWETLPPMHVGHWGHQASSLSNGRVLITGNESGDIFDPTSGEWSMTAPPASYRLGHQAVTLADGRVLVVGGSGCASGSPELLVETYDPGSDTWHDAGWVPHELGLTATALADGRVLIAGGGRSCDDDPGGFGPFADAFLINPSTIGR